MGLFSSRDDFTFQIAQSSKERDRAVPDIVVGLTRGNPRAQRQHGLGPVERLHLGLLIDTKDQRFVGRMQVDPYHIAQLS